MGIFMCGWKECAKFYSASWWPPDPTSACLTFNTHVYECKVLKHPWLVNPFPWSPSFVVCLLCSPATIHSLHIPSKLVSQALNFQRTPALLCLTMIGSRTKVLHTGAFLYVCKQVSDVLSFRVKQKSVPKGIPEVNLGVVLAGQRERRIWFSFWKKRALSA